MKRWSLAAMALLVCGCGGQDVDRLGRICTMAAGKFNEMAGGAHGKLANGWDAVFGAISETAPEARVSARLRWDKALEKADIQVLQTGPGVVRLQGNVIDEAQQQRAVELAESTQGVEQVVNDLVIGKTISLVSPTRKRGGRYMNRPPRLRVGLTRQAGVP